MRLDWEKVKDELQECVLAMQVSGLQVDRYEVGPRTYELMQLACLAVCNDADLEPLKQEFTTGVTGFLFDGVIVVLREDVPEYKLWPPSETSVFATTRRLRADMESV